MSYQSLKDLPPKPKRALGSFFAYKRDNYDKLKSQNPELKLTELTSLIGERYKQMTDKEKLKYESQYKEEKKVSDKALEEWNTKYGEIEKKLKLLEKGGG